MPVILAKYMGDYVGQEVTLQGWVRLKRKHGKIRFVELRDGSAFVQCVFIKGETSDQAMEDFKKLTQESSIEVTGVVQQNPRDGSYELLVKEMKIYQISEPFPITPKEHGIDFLMDHRHLWLRSKRQWAILRVRAEIIKACRDFFDERDFVLVDSPILTPNAAEGSTTLFKTDYFGETAYLTQSGQLYSEAAIAAFKKVYCFGPTFRAEKSKTRRHLMEFWMVEPEMAFATLEDVMNLAEEFVEYIVARVLDKRMEELKILERDISKLEKIKRPFIRMTYTEAVEQLHKLGSDIVWGDDFGGDDETILTKQYDKPILVHRFPASFKAFYFELDKENPELALGVDVLAPEGYGEIVGGGERSADIKHLLEKIREEGIPEENYKWYLDLRRYGSVPHGGFGLGIERTVAWICGLHHVRETIPWPRMLNRLYP
ncbi:asparaginyl-tRNA synthetase [Thermotomaculum hydrothermale]|uniref:Asparagine--tRNA ligase n=1 Tax=Thermotomaculum hydrothermale TaxID=981385 RepID=A0A7R6PQA4_9BACT|nr:asparagine--tRNA ligase [Thermotomaculum hydrothermale]BBB32381.1 asparaginyl-tRNA synthetase [Thermotomaculum hydrothermale]